MILQRLAEHYERIAAEAGLALPGSSMQKVSFCIVLEPDGRLNSLEDLRRPEGKVQRPRMLMVPGQSKPPGAGLSPCFLWDSPEYLLGFSLDPKKAERAPKAFAAFRAAHLALESAIALPEFAAVCRFLESWQPEHAQEHLASLTECATNFGVFRLAGEQHYVHEVVKKVVSTEDREQLDSPRGKKATGLVQGTCLITGQYGEIARLHEPAIKGVKDANTMGAKLVCFDKDAFTSYGKDQSRNAPVSLAATFKYTNALNHLLSQNDRRVYLGDATVVYWADSVEAEDQVTLDAISALYGGLAAPDEEEGEAGGPAEDLDALKQARILLNQMRDGTAMAGLRNDDESRRFFLLGLSPNASRLSVRLWVESTARELRGRLASHVQDLALSGGRDDRPVSLRRIVTATGRAERDPKGRVKGYNTKFVSPQLAGDLGRAVLTGAPYPQSLLSTVVRRIRSDGDVAFTRVSAVKAVLVRNSRLRGAPLEITMELKQEGTSAAYRCGQIFAVLERAQEASVKEDNPEAKLSATIKDRFFGAAAATPLLVLPRLLVLNGHHLRKLKEGSKAYFNGMLGRIMQDEPFEFPRQLTLEQQGQFIIGYFQQRQSFFKTKEQRAEQAKNEETVSNE